VEYIFLSREVPLSLQVLKIIKDRVSFSDVVNYTENDFRRLLTNLKSVDEVSIRGIDDKVSKFADKSRGKTFERIKGDLQVCQDNNIRCLSYFDKEYPSLLKTLKKPPKLIFIKGDIKPEDKKAVAIIGTRNPTRYGIKMTKLISQRLVERGFTIVSGFAKGIDTIAMESALDSGGRAIGVIASGILNLYPKENQYLVEKLVRNGAILSERFPSKNITKKALIIRNRITSGLGLGNIFIEGNKFSGTRHQFNFGAEQNKPAFAVEPIDNEVEQAFIPNWIINEKGGGKITTIDDVDSVVEALLDEYEERMRFKPDKGNNSSRQTSLMKY
jgi:DNA processing protein